MFYGREDLLEQLGALLERPMASGSTVPRLSRRLRFSARRIRAAKDARLPAVASDGYFDAVVNADELMFDGEE